MKSFLSFMLLLLCSFLSIAQTGSIPIPERHVTMTVNNMKIPMLLTRLGQAAGFSFSYNAALIDDVVTVNLDVQDKTIREVLNMLFKGTINFKEKGNHLILTKAPIIQKKTTAIFIISGYIEDEATGKKIADASVYDKNTLSSAVTDQFGYYKLKLDPDKKQAPVLLSVSKRNYRDTLVMITANENQYITIAIRPVGSDSILVAASIPADSTSKEASEIKMPYDGEANVRNIHDTLYREVQVAVLPFIGTNGRLGGNVINDYSINIFGGYSLGTRQIELGFFLNADRGDVSWLQIAGIGNLVGRNVYGIQAAGTFNITGGEVKALQVAGIANTNLGEVRGIQVAGLINTNLKSADGVLVAGLVNFTNKESEGVQVAGLANLQMGTYKGSQFAGLSNITHGHVEGSQISGIFNFARKVHGSQIGFINYADSLTGVPIGFISFVKSGYHKLEISADEIFYTNLAFRTGVPKFYNIITVGIKPENTFGNAQNIWTFGYGIGTAPKLSRTLSLNVDLTSNQVNQGGFTTSLSVLNKVYLGLDVKVARKFSLTFGATVNGYLSSTKFTDSPFLFTDYAPKIFYDHNLNSRTNLKMWFGAKVGLRFL